jgi:hypothetical protein
VHWRHPDHLRHSYFDQRVTTPLVRAYAID